MRSCRGAPSPSSEWAALWRACLVGWCIRCARKLTRSHTLLNRLCRRGTFTPADFTAELAGKSVDDFLQAVAEGKLYVNVHTKQFTISALDGELQLAGGGGGPAPAPAPTPGPLPPPQMWTARLDR